MEEGGARRGPSSVGPLSAQYLPPSPLRWLCTNLGLAPNPPLRSRSLPCPKPPGREGPGRPTCIPTFHSFALTLRYECNPGPGPQCALMCSQMTQKWHFHLSLFTHPCTASGTSLSQLLTFLW